MATVANAQTDKQTPAAQNTEASLDLSYQSFHCNTGYTLADCEEEIAKLKVVLGRYHVSELGQWTWVLVRSQEWAPLIFHLKLKPQTPALTALDRRHTFLEEALFKRQALRSIELAQQWPMPLDKLLDLAVTHELGHAICGEADESIADHFGAELRQGHALRCRPNKRPSDMVTFGPNATWK